MVESHLTGGRQDLVPGRALMYGQSITDACLGWDDSVRLLERLALAIQSRRRTYGTARRHVAVSETACRYAMAAVTAIERWVTILRPAVGPPPGQPPRSHAQLQFMAGSTARRSLLR